MKIKKEMITRVFGNEAVLVPVGDAMKEHNGMFMLSETAVSIWNILPECESEEEIAKRLCEEYEVSFEDAKSDAHDFLSQLRSYGIID